ncbi:MAG: hypothetical protein HPY75_09300 [Actinobacteria bacterium]|nr:hypothetical protein [Actinomycetota bacterium]
MVVGFGFKVGGEMEFMVFGEGWLRDILGAAGVPGETKEKVRRRLSSPAGMEGGGLVEEWKVIDRLLKKGRTGEALERAMGTVARTAEDLRELLGDGADTIERPFSPFLVKGKEVRAVLHPREDIDRLARSGDEFDMIRALELINDARRLLASWGAEVWGKRPLKLIPRLEEDVDGLRRTQAELPEEDEYLEVDPEKEIELADRFATMATRFAQDLLRLHILNAGNPEVRLRFSLLWNNVAQLEEDGDVQAAALEALQVLEEAFELAGMGGGETLEKVDMLYGVFSDAEELRSAVNSLSNISSDGGTIASREEGRAYIEAIRRALADMGLEPV